MNSKIKGILLGLLFSLGGVAVWIFCSTVLEIIAGLAGALMGYLFVLGYQSQNKQDNGNLVFILGAAVLVVEIVIAELISLAIIAGMLESTLSEVLAIEGMTGAVILDIVIGLALSGAVFGAIIFDRKKKMNAQSAYAYNQQAVASNAYQAETLEQNNEAYQADPFAATQQNEGTFEKQSENAE